MDASARTLNMVAGREHLEVIKFPGVGDGWLGYIAGIIKLNLFAGHQALRIQVCPKEGIYPTFLF